MQIPFSVSIGAIFVIIFVVTFIVLIATSFVLHRQIIESLSQDLSVQISSNVMKETDAFIKPARLFSEIVSGFISEQGKISIQDTTVQSMIINLLRNHTQLKNAYLGLEDGTCLVVSNYNGLGVIQIAINETQEFKLNDKNKVVSERVLPKPLYDARTKEWYKGALQKQEMFLTKPYRFEGMGQDGITISFPIYGENNAIVGVMGMDILITQFNQFLEELKITQGTHILIVNNSNQIIFRSRPAVRGMGNSRSWAGSQSTLLEEALDHYRDIKKVTFSMDVKEHEFLVSLMRFSSGLTKDWKFALITPKRELLSEAVKVNELLIVIAGGILCFGTLLILLLSKSISKPIDIIARKAKDIQSLKDTGLLTINSHIKEIVFLKESINGMNVALQSFSHYIPKKLVKQLVYTNEVAKISGNKKELTMLFTDVEEFSTFSDKLSPSDTAKYLSEYFEVISTEVLKNQGTIDKYIGDAVMAFWGAPQDVENHVDKAAECVLAVQDYLNSEEVRSKEYLSKLITRFGLHTGDVTVGNVGSSERFNYTIIGRDVNICSRLESLNKHFGTYILISETTKAQLSETFLTRKLDRVQLKGVEAAIQVYELVAKSETASDELKSRIQEYEAAHLLVEEQQWERALKGYKALQMRYPKDPVLAYYCKLIEKQIESSDSWDGIVRMTHK